ncbi:MAG: hypothetical protein ACJ8GN_07135 [Longimicrobiaceae bacterium]
MFRRFAFAALPALFACAPAVTHGPRVEPGPSLVMTGGVPRPLCDEWSDCHGGVTPTFGAGVRYGRVPRDAGAPAWMAGLTVPVFDPAAVELDGFVQAPSPGAWVWGGGALASVRHLMPYAEVGRMPAGGGDGWYLSAGYAHLFRDPTADIGPDETDSESMARPPRFWSPGAGARVNFRGVRWTVFANGSFGSYLKRTLVFGPGAPESPPPPPDTVRTRVPIRTLMLGIAWEVPFRDADRHAPPRPRRVPPPDPRLPPPETP